MEKNANARRITPAPSSRIWRSRLQNSARPAIFRQSLILAASVIADNIKRICLWQVRFLYENG